MLDAEPASGCASARIFSSASAQRVRRAADDVAQVETRERRQPRLGGDEPLDRRAAHAQNLRLHVRRLARRTRRRAAASPAASPADRSAACPGRPACWRRRRAATAPCRGASAGRARRPAPAASRPACPRSAAACGTLGLEPAPSPRARPRRPDRCRRGSTCIFGSTFARSRSCSVSPASASRQQCLGGLHRCPIGSLAGCRAGLSPCAPSRLGRSRRR